jgi:acyl-CoA thioesterase-1
MKNQPAFGLLRFFKSRFPKAGFHLAILLLPYFFSISCRSTTSNSSQESKENQSHKEISVKRQKRIVFFGNSLTAGLGLPESNQSFPQLIQSRIDSLELPYKVINAGLSGETSAGGAERIGWLLKDSIDLFVLELGANDGLRGIPVESTAKNLQSIIDQVHHAYPQCQILLAGMMMPPSMGQTYTDQFKNIFPTLAASNDLVLIPFLLEGVAGDPAFNLQDGIHPNPAGHLRIREIVWTYLAPLL